MNPVPLIKLYRSETVHSLLSRVHLISGEKNPLETLTNVVGVRGYKPMSGLPTHIKDIVKSLSLDTEEKEVIDYHTHLPFYRTFTTENKYLSIQSAMLDQGATKSRLGLLRNHVGANEVLRYCEACIKGEVQNHGFPFWHRELACPWVYFCPVHKLLLSEVDYRKIDYRERALLLPGTADPIDIRLKDTAAERLICLTEQTFEIMQGKHESICTENIYHRLLASLGLATKKNHIKQIVLTKMVEAWLCPIRDIKPFDRLFGTLGIERCWVSSIAADEKGFHHPIKHLILLSALNLEFRDLLLISRGGVQLDLPLKKEKRKSTNSEIRNAIDSEGSLSRAAKKLGVCVTTLCVEADRLGIERARRAKTITDELKGEVLNLSREGKNTSELANHFKISITSVNRIKRSST